MVIFIFSSNVLVQFCIILVRNDMFSKNKRSSDLVINFYYVIDAMYIYSWKKLIKFWPILVIQLRKSRFFLFAHGSQFDIVVTSPWRNRIGNWWAWRLWDLEASSLGPSRIVYVTLNTMNDLNDHVQHHILHLERMQPNSEVHQHMLWSYAYVFLLVQLLGCLLLISVIDTILRAALHKESRPFWSHILVANWLNLWNQPEGLYTRSEDRK